MIKAGAISPALQCNRLYENDAAKVWKDLDCQTNTKFWTVLAVDSYIVVRNPAEAAPLDTR